jgi:hypothetical protein
MPSHLKQILPLQHWYPVPNNTENLRDNYLYSHCQQNVRSHTGKLDVLQKQFMFETLKCNSAPLFPVVYSSETYAQLIAVYLFT